MYVELFTMECIIQTFLPLPSFKDSVVVLDYRRLGKQRVECKQLLKAITIGGAYSNHPAAKMWKGYEEALESYMYECIQEWVKRGYKNTMTANDYPGCLLPPWFGNKDFHASHRSNLLRKDAIYYGKFGWIEPNNLPYIWPT